MNKSDDKLLLEDLVRLKHKIIVEGFKPEPYQGICVLIVRAIQQEDVLAKVNSTYRKLADLFKGWKYHNGERAHPVPIPKNCAVPNTKHGYGIGGAKAKYHKWEGQQLMYRLDLLCYVINKLEKKVKAETAN